MAEHVDIEDSERHEPKGASTATDGQYLRSNGDGSTSFATIDKDEVGGTYTFA